MHTYNRHTHIYVYDISPPPPPFFFFFFLSFLKTRGISRIARVSSISQILNPSSQNKREKKKKRKKKKGHSLHPPDAACLGRIEIPTTMPQPLRSNSRNCISTLERTPSARSKRTRTEPQLFQAHHVLVHLVDAIIRWAKRREKGKERRRRRRVTIMMAMLEFGCLIRGWLEYGTTLASSSFGCITPSLMPFCLFVHPLFFSSLFFGFFFLCLSACSRRDTTEPPSPAATDRG